MDGAGDGLHLAGHDDRALDGAIVADRAGIEGACDAGVGGDAAAAHSITELGALGDPSVDGPWRHVEKLGQFVVGRAEQAVVVRLLAHSGSKRVGRPIAVMADYNYGIQ